MDLCTQNRIDLSPRQESTVIGTIERITGGKDEVTIAGLAGTGKSALIPFLHEGLSKHFANVFVLTPTGKAALVLRRNGIPAKTIHSMAYNYVGYDEIEDKPIFVHRQNGRFACAVICDEASMTSFDAWRNLTQRGFPIVWVGDPFQLPPVESRATPIFGKPDYTLTEIHRQKGLDNPIVLFAHAIRNGEASINDRWDGITHHDSLGMTCNEIAELALASGLERVITWRNLQRNRLNAAFREVQGFGGVLQEGEQIICLKNDKDNGIYNGQIFDVVGVDFSEDCIRIGIRDRDITGGHVLEVTADPEQFGKEKTLGNQDNDLCLFDYAYALTCHKAQGSQWDKIGVAGASGDARWQYTAVTRAKDGVFVFS
jgi:exodeoxyribonuclease V